MQKVVRTCTPDRGYWGDGKRTEDLRRLLADGYKVVMCNKLSNGEFEWLEYIVEKEEVE